MMMMMWKSVFNYQNGFCHLNVAQITQTCNRLMSFLPRLWLRNVSWKFIHNFSSNYVHTQTDRRTDRQTDRPTPTNRDKCIISLAITEVANRLIDWLIDYDADDFGSWLSDGCRADVIDATLINLRCDHQASFTVIQVWDLSYRYLGLIMMILTLTVHYHDEVNNNNNNNNNNTGTNKLILRKF